MVLIIVGSLMLGIGVFMSVASLEKVVGILRIKINSEKYNLAILKKAYSLIFVISGILLVSNGIIMMCFSEKQFEIMIVGTIIFASFLIISQGITFLIIFLRKNRS